MSRIIGRILDRIQAWILRAPGRGRSLARELEELEQLKQVAKQEAKRKEKPNDLHSWQVMYGLDYWVCSDCLCCTRDNCNLESCASKSANPCTGRSASLEAIVDIVKSSK